MEEKGVSIIASDMQIAGETFYLTDDQKVKKKILVSGDEDVDWYEKGVDAHVDYEGRLAEDGEVFDRSQYPKPFTVKMGAGQVIRGWEIGIKTMKIGEKAEFHINHEYAYGGPGKPPKIPQMADLIFKIELLQAGGQASSRWCYSDTQLIERAEFLKGVGNGSFKSKKYLDAIGKYRDAMAHIEQMGKNHKPENAPDKGICGKSEEEIKQLKKTLLQNMSICTNNTGHARESIANMTKVIELDGETSKALYLRSVAYMKAECFGQSQVDIVKAIKMSPNDKQLREQLAAIKEFKQTQGVGDKKLITNFFKKGVYSEKETKKEATIFKTLPEFNAENAQTFFDIEIGTDGKEGHEKGRVVFEVFTKQVPKTAENFR